MFSKIYIEITNICNLKCRFCKDTKRKKEFMSPDAFEKIIQKIAGYTNLVCLHVKGEPLLHPNLERILAILEKYQLQANITTNGTLITDKIEILKKSKAVRQLNISLHSLSQNNTLDESYLKQVLDTTSTLENIIISYRLWNDSKDNQKIFQMLEALFQKDNIEEQLNQKNYVILKENVFLNRDQEFTWPNLSGPKIIESGHCLALRHQIAILVDGTVVPCCMDNDGDIPLGNILEEDLEDILEKPKTKEIKNNFQKGKIANDLCYTCGFLKRLESKRKV